MREFHDSGLLSLYGDCLQFFDRLDFPLFIIEHLNGFTYSEGNGVCRVPHIVNDHVHEDPVVFEFFLHVLHLAHHQVLGHGVMLGLFD